MSGWQASQLQPTGFVQTCRSGSRDDTVAARRGTRESYFAGCGCGARGEYLADLPKAPAESVVFRQYVSSTPELGLPSSLASAAIVLMAISGLIK